MTRERRCLESGSPKHAAEELVMQMRATDPSETNKVTNKTMITADKKLVRGDTLPLIESDVGPEEEKHCSFVVQKKVVLYIIHFMHILFSLIRSALLSKLLF